MQWGIEPIAAVTSASDGNVSQSVNVTDTFAALMQRELTDVNTSLGVAETAMRDLAAGKPVELHELMISLERARISVQTFVQVRNKMIESFQDLMRMQL